MLSFRLIQVFYTAEKLSVDVRLISHLGVHIVATSHLCV